MVPMVLSQFTHSGVRLECDGHDYNIIYPTISVTTPTDNVKWCVSQFTKYYEVSNISPLILLSQKAKKNYVKSKYLPTYLYKPRSIAVHISNSGPPDISIISTTRPSHCFQIEIQSYLFVFLNNKIIVPSLLRKVISFSMGSILKTNAKLFQRFRIIELVRGTNTILCAYMKSDHFVM